MNKAKKVGGGARGREGQKPAWIRHPFVAPMEKMQERNGADWTEEVNRAVREYLERAGLWPLPGGEK